LAGCGGHAGQSTCNVHQRKPVCLAPVGAAALPRISATDDCAALFCSGSASKEFQRMDRWRIQLLPPPGMQRARPRWLCDDGGFSLDQRRAWVVTEPRCAGERIQRWLMLKGRDAQTLQRMRLVHSCCNAAAEPA
jgi:hypothetical protein